MLQGALFQAILLASVFNVYIRHTAAEIHNGTIPLKTSPNSTKDEFARLQLGNSSSDEIMSAEKEGNESLEGNITPSEIPIEIRVRDTLLFQIAMGIHFYYLPVIVVVGLFGNIITTTVMLQKKNRGSSCCLYMANLAVSDTGVLLYGAFTWFDAKFQLIPKTDLSCGAANLVLGLVSNYNVMILVAITVDRFLAIRFPLKINQLCTVGRVKVTMVVLAVLSSALTFPVLFTAKSPDGRTCAAHASGTLLDQIHAVVTLIVFSLAPFFSLFFMNIAIIRLIRNRHKNFVPKVISVSAAESVETISSSVSTSSMQPQPQSRSRNEKNGGTSGGKISGNVGSKQDVQLTIMLVTVSFTFLLMILPLYIRYIIGSLLDYKQDLNTFAAYYLLLVSSAKTHITNSGINFFLYCLSGSRFRADVMELFCGKKRSGNWKRTLSERRDKRDAKGQTMSSISESSMISGSVISQDQVVLAIPADK